MAEKSKNWVDSFGELFAKLPPLPAGVREFIVAITPWLALIFGIIGVLGSLAAFGISTAFAPIVIMGGSTNFGGLMIVSILSLVESVLALIAFPGLLKKRAQGWTFLFWSEVVGVVASVVSINIGSVIFALIGFYILFQIRSYYK